MDIAAVSTSLSQSGLQQSVGISILKQSMDAATEQNQVLIQMMQQSVQPYLGGNLDIKI
ncbi:YjfB family protein [Gordoniibacillus kamchatkensis]|uniref:YjfB family protein n=1 Tax=Gordoniibacillus kamchatkensis TaxID=1590651 RepID=UPI0009E65986|nr:YjfB family protein [Paenibacillus sp. VKM B-2647]